MYCTYLPTLYGEWINLEKMHYLAIERECENFFVIAVMQISVIPYETKKWQLSSHKDEKCARESLNRLMFHFSPVPLVDHEEDFIDDYNALLKNLYYLNKQ